LKARSQKIAVRHRPKPVSVALSSLSLHSLHVEHGDNRYNSGDEYAD
jgi:hypothetical protein